MPVVVEPSLPEGEVLFRTLIEQVPAIVYLDAADPDGETGYSSVYLSPYVTTILGYFPEEFIADPGLWSRILHPEDRERALAADADFYRSGEDLGQEYRLVARDGRIVWVRDHAALIRDEHGVARYAHGVLIDITEQKKAEESVRDSELRYRSLVEQIPAITYLDARDEANPRGYRTIYVSPQVEPLLGYRPEELIQDPQPWDRLIHPDDLDRVLAEDARVTANLRPWDTEYRMVARDGSVIWVRDQAVVLEDQERKPAYWHGVIFDITARRVVEEQLREAEARYRALVEEIPAVTYVDLCDEQLTPVYVSPQVESILGVTPAEFIGADLWETCIHPDDRERAVAETFRGVARGEAFGIEYRMIASDGRVVWVHDRATVLTGEDGRPGLVQGVLLDISKRKEAEERLHEAEHRFRTLVEEIPAATYVYTETGPKSGTYATTYESPQLATVLGLPGVVLKDQEGWIATIHPADRPRVLAEERRTDLTGDPFRAEYRAMAADGRVLWLRDEAVLVRNESGQPREWLGVIFDITDRKEAEARLQGYSEELEKANTLLQAQEQKLRQALEELSKVEAERRGLLDRTVDSIEDERRRIAVELHDGPIQHLTALDYTLETARRRLAAGETEAADESLAGTQELLRDDIGALRQLMSGLRPPALDEYGIDAALRDYVSVATAGSAIVCTVDVDLPTRLDPAVETVLYRVAQEALMNVIKHSGGSKASVVLRQKGGSVVLQIRDNGMGVDPESHPGPEALAHYGVMGMQTRAEMVGGRCAIESSPGGGTLVRAVVPLASRHGDAR